MQILYVVGLFVLGACLGSFSGAMVWRLRARQLAQDAESNVKLSEAEKSEYRQLKQLAEQGWLKGRSIDLETGQQLAWHDMIPVLSWLALRGKSRFNGKPIGVMELLLEVGLGSFFVIAYLTLLSAAPSWVEVVQLAIWLLAGVLFAVMMAYDWRWSLLPSSLTSSLISLGAINVLTLLPGVADKLHFGLGVIGSVAILSGLYWVLYYISKERWIGFGDVVLGLGLALLLVRWELAFLALFLANFIGLVAVLPGLIMKRLGAASRVPFGPFMIIGAVIAMFWGDFIIVNLSTLSDTLVYSLWYN